LCFRPSGFRKNVRGEESEFINIWKAVFNLIDKMFEKNQNQIQHLQSVNDPTTISDQINLFDVSLYWRDWAKSDQ